MQNKITDIPLHDIKPILEIKEYSFYYFLGFSFLVLCMACAAIYLIYKYIKNKNRYNIRKEHLKLLNSTNLDDAKKAAYEITFYGATFKDDTPEHMKMYDDMVLKLQEYKYKKEVEPLDEEALKYIELYRGMCNV